MFEWGGGTLWGKNQRTRETFGVGNVEYRLPITPRLLKELENMTEWHDTALNWEYPPDPGPWSAADVESFEKAAKTILHRLRAELGPEFDVQYISLLKRM